MAIPAGTYRLGPGDGTLSLRTKRTGAVAKAGHDLLIHVTSWEATIEAGADPAETSIELTVDGSSLRVREGTGGIQKLDDDDRANIEQTIDDEILKRQAITFRSTRVQPAGEGGGLGVQGDLTLLGTTRPLTFDLVLADGGSAQRRRDGQADRLGHQAVLRAVRGAEGRRRGRGRDRRHPAGAGLIAPPGPMPAQSR